MLEHMLSFWRRLLGQPLPPGEKPDPAPGAERQVWISRPPTQAVVPPANATDRTRLPARVRALSSDAIRLMVSRGFDPGELVTVELPAIGERASSFVLATVIQSAPQGSEWALDCAFASELTEEEMHSLGAQRIKASPTDRRTWVRFPSSTTASWNPVTTAERSLHSATVQDISANGVGLLVDESVTPGTMLSVELIAATGTFSRNLLACVVRITPGPNGQWLAGCSFLRALEESELRNLL